MASKQTGTRSKQSQRQTSSKPKTSNSKRTNQTKGKPTASRSSKTQRNKQVQEYLAENESIRDEVILIVTALTSFLLLLSNFDLCGPVGKQIKTFFFGLLGHFTYLFPFALFFFIAFAVSNRGSVIARRKIIGSIVLIFTLTSLIQLLEGYNGEMKYFDYYLQSAKNSNGGGLIGGTLVSILCPLFGTIASVIILIVMLLLCFIFITGKALLTLMREKGEQKLNDHRQLRENYAKEFKQLDMEDETYGEERRKPRIVNLQKQANEKVKSFFDQDEDDEDDLKYDEMEDGPVNFLEELKRRGKDKKQNQKKEVVEEPISVFEMTEIKSEQNDGLNSETNFSPSEDMLQEVNSIYEDELNRKFGQNEDNNEVEINTSYEVKNIKPLNANTEFYKDDAVKETKDQNVNVDSNLKDVSAEASVDSSSHMPEGNNDNKAKPKEVKAESGSEDILTVDQKLEPLKKYEFPPIELLGKPKANQRGMSDKDLKETAIKLQKTLESFGVRVTITNISCGPAVTRYELQPEQGVKVSKITGLSDDIKLNLAAADVRIEAPIPGKAAVGIEVPNKENSAVMLRELLESKEFNSHPSDIAFAVGKDIGGQAVVTDIAKMPHLLIAGATGSGKSVCINTLIMNILYKANPADVRLIMVDPKVVELSVYNGIPHLLIPVVTDPKKASAALNWAVMEMTDRYKKFAEYGVRDLKGYNEKVAEIAHLNDPAFTKLPQIVIIVDELADLMMVAPGEVEDAICRLAQMARAAGLHLIIATQRPSVNVITGLIKANVPSRIAFSVSSAIDSRTILDGSGAEKLLGKGDMLFFPSGYPKPVRVQGAFVSDKEVSAVVDFLKSQNHQITYNEEINDKIKNAQVSSAAGGASGGNDRDEYFIEAGKFIIEKDKASIGMLQRVYKIGFNRAARIMEQLSDAGVVGPEEGTKPRKILMSMEEFEQYVDEYV
ncbi:FtsK/SpoIIIE family DNA translocase [Lachnoclostridium phytofermentans]|uniref:Cell divisionFtsK/SpoIIIE n=1 Tax=Lachnoclostridium phytofermentans (strain ATCC 700394 / DSM 18823 / ISDg) TaxID=357809 RepID=A9KNK0_LACP7|nr:DNA translocase FtsK [Lachnoclostridium phytofermentans]ABX43117.1 cell divisionFtsK/SpoIIIE [Lachnoclostridium phytofermentans ISDg]